MEPIFSNQGTPTNPQLPRSQRKLGQRLHLLLVGLLLLAAILGATAVSAQGEGSNKPNVTNKFAQNPDCRGSDSGTVSFNPVAPNPLPINKFDTSFRLICDAPEEVNPAYLDLVLEVTPKEAVSTDPETLVNFTLTVKNTELGKATASRLYFPLNPNLKLGYASFSDRRMWVAEIVSTGNAPYLKIAMPVVEPGQTMTATVVFRPAAQIKADTVTLDFKGGWDDDQGAGKTNSSNPVTFKFASVKS